MKRFILLLVIIPLVAGCAHVVSKNMRMQAETAVPVQELFRDPEHYRGRVFIIGGTIVTVVNAQDGTYIEIVEKPLDYRGRPEHSDISRGRSIILHEGYLDTSIFAQGRSVTVAGEVLGTRVQPLGEVNYRYLFLKSREIHLLKPGYDLPVHFGIGIYHSF